MILNPLQRHLTSVFLKIFLRDRRSIFFSLFFPVIFMTVFSLANDREQEPINIGVANLSSNQVASDFVQRLSDSPVFNTVTGESAPLREALIAGDQTMVLELPADFGQSPETRSSEINVVVDAAQVSQLGLIMPVLEQTLLSIEREFRGIAPLFTIAIEDVQARSQRYIDFLLPGLMALTLMNLSIAGSGFNIVEYRRKGILKRLFVTPIEPKDFITAIVFARMTIVLVQLTVLIVLAVVLLDIRIVGNFFAYYFVVILGTVVFLMPRIQLRQSGKNSGDYRRAWQHCHHAADIPVRDLLSDRVDAGMDTTAGPTAAAVFRFHWDARNRQRRSRSDRDSPKPAGYRCVAGNQFPGCHPALPLERSGKLGGHPRRWHAFPLCNIVSPS